MNIITPQECCVGARRERTAMVYFIHERQTPYVKIGYTRNIPARLRYLNGPQKNMELMFSILGGREQEKTLHAIFREYRYECEFFVCDGALRSYLRELLLQRIVKHLAATDRVGNYRYSVREAMEKEGLAASTYYYLWPRMSRERVIKWKPSKTAKH